MIGIIKTCLPFILMIIIGMVCREKEILSEKIIGGFKKYVVNFGLPVRLAISFFEIKYNAEIIIISLLMIVVLVLALLSGRSLKKLFKVDQINMPFFVTIFEIGMFGFPMFEMLYPDEGLATIAVIDIGVAIFGNTVYRALIDIENGREKPSIAGLCRNMMKSPVVAGIIFGIVMGATGLYDALKPSGVADVLTSCMELIGAPTNTLILIALGYDLVFKDMEWKPVLLTCAARIITMIILRIGAGLVFNALGYTGYEHALNVTFILPSSFILPVFARNKEESPYLVSCISFYSVLTIIAFVVLAIIR